MGLILKNSGFRIGIDFETFGIWDRVRTIRDLGLGFGIEFEKTGIGIGIGIDFEKFAIGIGIGIDFEKNGIWDWDLF